MKTPECNSWQQFVDKPKTNLTHCQKALKNEANISML